MPNYVSKYFWLLSLVIILSSSLNGYLNTLFILLFIFVMEIKTSSKCARSVLVCINLVEKAM